MGILHVLIVGVVATATADLWQQALKRAVGLPASNWRMVGRWVAGMRRGVFAHRAIAAAPAEPGEHALGWAVHYVVGVIYAAAFLGLAAALGRQPALAGALAFGAATLAAPWFVLQPAMGFGVMARRSPRPGDALVTSTTTHVMFGVGLYLGLLVAEAAGS